VAAPIKLNDHALFETGKIDNEFTNWNLPAKVKPGWPKRAQS